MTTYLFSVPWQFHRDPHPLDAGPDDMIEVAIAALDASLDYQSVKLDIPAG